MRIQIQSDRYTKTLLSIIAGAGVWLCAERWFALPSLSAQSTQTTGADKPLASQPTSKEEVSALLKRRAELRMRAGRRVIEAQEFSIVDEAGEKLGAFEAIDGTAQMYLRAQGAWVRATCEKNLSVLDLGDGAGEVSIMSNAEGTVYASFGNAITLTSLANGAVKICLGKEEQGGVLTIRRRATGESDIVMRDAQNIMRLALSVDADGKPKVVVSDKSQPRAILGVNTLSATKTGDEETTAESTLVLFGKDGKVLWRAP